MKKYWVLVLGILMLAGAPARAASNKGWILTQKSEFSDGESQIYLSPVGMKSSMLGLTTILRLADNKIFMLNDGKKEYSESTFEEWKKMTQDLKSAVEGLGMKQEETTEKSGTEQIAGLNAEKYVVKTKGGEFSVPGVDTKSLGLGEELKMPDTSREVWVTNDLAIPAQLKEFMQANNSSKGGLPPEAKGIILRLATTNDEGKKIVLIDTVKCEKAAIDDSIFEIPADYKKVEGFMGMPLKKGNE